MMFSNRYELLAWIGNRIGKPPGWERIVRRLAPPGRCGLEDVCIVRDGSVFLAQPSVWLGWNVAFFGSYEPELRTIFAAVLPTGGVAIDVGANVGWHTLLMGRLVGPQGRVFAAEPNPSVRDRLVENVSINRMKHVEIVPCALGDTVGTVDFLAPDAADSASGSGHVVPAGGSSAGIVRVDERRLDDIVDAAQLEQVDLIKIDVEGYEWPVLCGSERTLARFRPHVVFEFDRAYARRGGGDPVSIAEYFTRHRYKLYAVGRAWARKIGPENWPDAGDVWAVPSAPCASR